jgi:hypothetical protein
MSSAIRVILTSSSLNLVINTLATFCLARPPVKACTACADARSGGGIAVKTAAQILLLLTVIAGLAFAQAPAPPALYGTGWQAFAQGLENLRLGPDGPKFDIRFRAEQSDKLKSVILFMKTGSGYSGGTGGVVNISLQSDDGTANHLPSGAELDSSQAAPGNPASPTFREFPFSGNTALTAGSLYHLVLTNADPSPSTNYVSFNNIFNPDQTPNPYYSFTDWGLNWISKSAWVLKSNSTPIAAIKYAGGSSQGMGYIDALGGSGLFNIQGSNQVAETFTVSGGNKTVTDVRVHIKKTGSPGALTVTLATTDGTAIEQGTIPASTIGTNYDWAVLKFASSHVLNNGSSYRVALSAPADSSNNYQVFPLQDGVRYGVDVPSEFHDGHYQNNTGSGWSDFKGRTDYDLQLYFSTNGVTASAPNPPTGLSAMVQ